MIEEISLGLQEPRRSGRRKIVDSEAVLQTPSCTRRIWIELSFSLFSVIRHNHDLVFFNPFSWKPNQYFIFRLLKLHVNRKILDYIEENDRYKIFVKNGSDFQLILLFNR